MLPFGHTAVGYLIAKKIQAKINAKRNCFSRRSRQYF